MHTKGALPREALCRRGVLSSPLELRGNYLAWASVAESDLPLPLPATCDMLAQLDLPPGPYAQRTKRPAKRPPPRAFLTRAPGKSARASLLGPGDPMARGSLSGPSPAQTVLPPGCWVQDLGLRRSVFFPDQSVLDVAIGGRLRHRRSDVAGLAGA